MSTVEVKQESSITQQTEGSTNVNDVKPNVAGVGVDDATTAATGTPPTTTTATNTNSASGNSTTTTTTTTTATIIPKSEQHASDELTKRLQKLALERQKESKGDRLKVIQDPNSYMTSHLTSVKTFQELNLPNFLLDAIFAMGFDRPSAIQEEALPRILNDPPRNLIGQAQSGSGKV
jgi:hypothetical protein